MEPLVKQHMHELRKHNHWHTNDWVMKELKIRFSTWLMEQDIPPGEIIEKQTIKVLASRPSCQVSTWRTYDISGFTFCTKSKDKKSMAQNNGV
jgi:hypothetical protein